MLASKGLKLTVDKPLMLTTDGHKSRFGIAAMEYCIENHISVYLLPPHASTLFQPLDQLFAGFHAAYARQLAVWKKDNQAPDSAIKPEPSRGTAVELMVAVIMSGWFSVSKHRGAWDKCGLYLRGVDMAKAVPDSKCLPSAASNTERENEFVNSGYVDYTPPLPEPSPKLDSETPTAYLSRVADHWKAVATRLAATPRSAREIGALPLPSGKSKAAADAAAAKAGKDDDGKATVWGQMNLADLVAVDKVIKAKAADKAALVAADARTEAPARSLLFSLGYLPSAGDKIVGTTHLNPFFADNKEVLQIDFKAKAPRIEALLKWIKDQGVDCTTGLPPVDAAPGVAQSFWVARVAPAAEKLAKKSTLAPATQGPTIKKDLDPNPPAPPNK